MKRIGVGIIGCGSIAKKAHIPSYIKTPECKLTAVADSNLENAKELASKYNIEHVFGDHQELLECNSVDAVSVCTPPATHCKIVVHACKANKHVLCEKPMALSLKEADLMIDAAKKSGVVLAIGHQLRFMPNVQKAHEFVRNEFIGKILTCYGELSGGGPFFEWKTSSNYYLKPNSGVDVIFNYGIHILDAFNFLFGEASRISGFIKQRQIRNVAVNDRAIVTIEYKDGVLAVLNTLYTASPDPDKGFIDIYGSEGKLSVRCYHPTMTLYKKNSILSRLHGSRKLVFRKIDFLRPYLLEINDFIRSIMDHKEPYVTGVDGRNALELALAAYRSYKLQQTVTLPLSSTD